MYHHKNMPTIFFLVLACISLYVPTKAELNIVQQAIIATVVATTVWAVNERLSKNII